MSIEQLKAIAQPLIDIPNFDNSGTIKVRVQRPRLMSMAAQGKIPNHLMSIAIGMITGKKPKKENMSPEEVIKHTVDTIELYCRACLVEPSYEEFKDIMTDDQKFAIFSWGIGEVSTLDSFRTNKGNGSSDNNGETLSEKTE